MGSGELGRDDSIDRSDARLQDAGGAVDRVEVVRDPGEERQVHVVVPDDERSAQEPDDVPEIFQRSRDLTLVVALHRGNVHVQLRERGVPE